MITKIRKNIQDFVSSSSIYPTITGIAVGIYPLLYYYNKNFTIVNSWYQFAMFLLTFVLIPVAIFNVLFFIGKKSLSQKSILRFITISNTCLFSFFIILSTYGLRKKILLIALLIAFSVGVLLYKHLNKIVTFQLLLALIILPKLIPDVVKHLSYSSDWTNQQDSIESTVFKQKPNVYVIQPDGYPNFSELKKEPYNFDNSEFETYLINNDFKLYENFRSNYFSTLSSNSSMLSMKHHYFNNPKPGANELYNSRDIIVGDNAVVKTFKHNGYQTNLLLEKSYLLLNRPKMGFDFCNVEQKEVSFLARGFEIDKDLQNDLKNTIDINSKKPNFYFVEKLKPGHINTYEANSKGKESERINYLEELKEANEWLKDIIEIIQQKDSNALVIVVADHGGFVGLEYTHQCKIKQTDEKIVKSIFTSALAIKWPNNHVPDFDQKLKTNVNLFRILFAYLSEDTSLLNNLQPDKSYGVIESGAPFGVYEYINPEYQVVFNKHEE